jgi:plastocyanin
MVIKTKMRWRLWLGLLFGFLSPFLTYGYEEITVTNGGSISGFVKVQGKLLRLAPLQVSKFKEVCKNVPNETLVIGPSQGVRHAVVTLEGVSKGKAFEREAVHELDNLNCRFVPHVLVASIGQFVLIKNSDPILHTAHAFFPENQPHFNVGLYPGKIPRKPFVTPGITKKLCEVHPWMNAYVVVTEHPYHAVTDV